MADCTCNNFPASLGNVTFGANVVIGTPTTPVARLHVVPTGNNPPAAVFEGAPGYQARIELVDKQGDDRTWMVVAGAWSAGNFGIYDAVAADYRLFIDTSGRVGIGTPSPSERLEVNGNVKAAGAVISQAPGVNASLQRDVDGDYLSISGGKTRRGTTGGGLIQLIGNAFAGVGGSLQFILGQGMTAARHIFYNSDATPAEIASIDNRGNLSLGDPTQLPENRGGAIKQIHGQPNVGIASNGFDDLIFNYGGQAGHGVVLWMWGAPQGGGDQGGGTQKMKLEVDGSLYINQNLALRSDGVANSCYYA